jgi:putative oxidoreductase
MLHVLPIVVYFCNGDNVFLFLLTEACIMKSFLTPDIGALLLRLSLGVILLAHSVYLKLLIFTLPGTASYFASLGLPSMSAYIVFALELVGGVAILMGIYSRWFSLLLIPVLLGATWAHWGNGWLFTNTGGGWEFPLLLVVLLMVQMSIGDGKHVINTRFSSVVRV